MYSHCHRFMHVESANNSHYGGDKHCQTQYTTRLHLRGSQIRLLPGNQIRERESWEDEGILYTAGNPEKKYRFLTLASLELNTLFFGGVDSDGMMEGIPLSFFWNSLACIF